MEISEFGSLMRKIFTCPPSSAGIERLFSSAALVHTKIRKRLSTERVQKLIQAYRFLKRKEKRVKCMTAEEDMEMNSTEVENIMIVLHELDSKEHDFENRGTLSKIEGQGHKNKK